MLPLAAALSLPLLCVALQMLPPAVVSRATLPAFRRCQVKLTPSRSRPQSPPPPPKYPTIQVRDYTTQDTDPHGRSFTITLMPDTSAGDIMHSLAPPRSGCEVHVCWGEGRRCLLDPRDDMWEVAKMCWLEVVDV